MGVSAGAFIAAYLANGLTASQMCRAIVKHEPGEHPFVPENFFTLAWRELGKRALSVPRLAFEALGDFVRHPEDVSPRESLTRLARALPVGMFDNEPIRAYLQQDLRDARGAPTTSASWSASWSSSPPTSTPGRPCASASRRSSTCRSRPRSRPARALPGLYPPVVIDGRHYVDGVLLKTLHASVALEAGAKLLICLNPIVPVDTATAVARGVMRRGKLIDRGLPSVLSQSVRTLVHSRLEAGMASYYDRFDGIDLVLIEPDRDDYKMFFTNIFSFSQRRAVCEHAYEATRAQLLERYEELAPLLARHGLTLNRTVLEDERTLWDHLDAAVEPEPARARGRDGRPGEVLDDLSDALDRLDALLAS